MASVSSVLNHFERFLELLQSKGIDQIGYELKTSVVREVVREHAIDTTAMIQAIDYHSDVVTNFETSLHIDTSRNPDVFYDGFVEFPTRNRDGSVRYGRYFYQKGIEHADIEHVFDGLANEAFVI